ncbi:glycoprotein 3-alpha-L-fucosyltransferase A-like [Haliotis rufescens]|uniref:glycoprotein 3-alpha-L-fucosyltransferase A-like n=1 Tax=Haliotis rufescens TaxID=6454 RepID=UPI00201F86BF|nr:glycoprotein 3-alpha-L-fucosyltransferase A-like [Haliotis rufescens]
MCTKYIHRCGSKIMKQLSLRFLFALVLSCMLVIYFTRDMIGNKDSSPLIPDWGKQGKNVLRSGIKLTDRSKQHISSHDSSLSLNSLQSHLSGGTIISSGYSAGYRTMPAIHLSDGEVRSLKLLRRLHVIEEATVPVSLDTKVILWYVPTRYHPVLSQLHKLRHCPEVKCRVTTNRAFYNQSDALVFTAQLIRDYKPPPKLPNQVWLLHNHESPHLWARHMNLYNEHWKDTFNWTMDYREDADVRAPYGYFERDKNGMFHKRTVSLSKNYTNILASKKGVVAWLVSNCHTMSLRHKYVAELNKYVRVDIFGECGSKTCARLNDSSCLETIGTEYKFYLAFENAFCKDYITEKFFRYYNANMIVIVRGGGDYRSVAPEGTFLNAADFESPKALANHINMLDKNDEEYIQLVRLKDQYEPIFEEWPIVQNGVITYMAYHSDARAMCEICDRLWNKDKYRKAYTDVGVWFKKGLCYYPKDV